MSRIIKELIVGFNSTPPSPHPFVTLQLHSGTLLALTEVLTQVDSVLPQLAEFITRFNDLIISNDINVITEVDGTLAIDAPATMSDGEISNIRRRIQVLDNLIADRTNRATELLEKGSLIDNQLKIQNPNHSSQILNKVREFEILRLNYKHHS